MCYMCLRFYTSLTRDCLDPSGVGCTADDNRDDYRELRQKVRKQPPSAQHSKNQSAFDTARGPIAVIIKRERVEIVDTYKFIVVQLNTKLDWIDNPNTPFL